MILIYPPVAKISEPPPGVAILAGALKEHKLDCKVVDANLEGMLWLAGSSATTISTALISEVDTWTRRAVTHLDRNISDLRNSCLYESMARYSQRVMELNRVIAKAPDGRFKVTLSDYTDSRLTPVKSEDLLTSARQYRQNPFYPFFERYLAQEIEEHHLRKKSSSKSSSLPCLESGEYPSDYIGISLCYLSQALTSFALAGWIRERFPEKKIVMGGGLVTSWMSMPTWNDPFRELIDCMVRGRGEDTLIALCSGSEKKSSDKEPLSIRANHKRSGFRAGTYMPDFDFARWDQYIAPGRILPFRITSGCYWNRCRFCPEKAEGNRYQPAKNSNLIDDLQSLVERYRPDYLHFIDDAIPPSFLKALNSTFQNPSFRWYGFVRFTKELADPQFCHDLYRSGCRLLKLGLESGDQAVLERMEKGTDLNLASQVLTALKSAGIHTYVYLLFGTQFEDEAAAARTLDYVQLHSDRISFLNLAIFNLPRFSEDAATLKTGIFSAGDLSLYLSFRHPSGWERKKVRRFLDRKFKKDPAIGEILKRDPPFFTSNHAMFVV